MPRLNERFVGACCCRARAWEKRVEVSRGLHEATRSWTSLYVGNNILKSSMMMTRGFETLVLPTPGDGESKQVVCAGCYLDRKACVESGEYLSANWTP